MLLIRRGTVYTMEGPVYEKGYVLCKENKIVEVGEDFSKSKYASREEDMEVIDATDCMVMPGILEAHCHVGITEEQKGLEGDDCNEGTNPITPQLRAIDAINPMDAAFKNAMEAGITGLMVGPGSSNVVGGQFAFVKTHGRCIDDMLVKTPTAMKVAFGENPKKTYGGQGNIPSTRMAIAAMLREELSKAKEYAISRGELEDTAAKENVGDACVGESKTDALQVDFCLEPWIPVLKGEIPLKAHVHRTDDILTAIRIGKEFELNVTLDHCSEGHLIIEEIKKSGYAAIVGPAMTSRNKIEVRNVDFKTPGELQKAGITVAITTDHPVTLIQYLPICAGMAVKKGMDYMEALKAITINPAKICGVADRVGSLKEGKDSDIAIFDGNPLEVATQNLYTIIDGQVVWDKNSSDK